MDETNKHIIKKYPNRRLYDTVASCYITLEEVKQLVLDKIDIQVVDAKSGKDISVNILLQIILEEEALGKPIFTYQVLTHIIRFYGHTMQGMVGSYLEKNLSMFVEMQQRLEEQGKGLYGKDFTMNSKLWNAFMTEQLPMMQSMVNSYLEQSNHLMLSLQEQWQVQATQLFQHFDLSSFNPFKAASFQQPSEDSGPEAFKK